MGVGRSGKGSSVSQDWRTANYRTMAGLRVVDRAIAERIGYTVSDDDPPIITRNKDNRFENKILPQYWADPVYPWNAFQPYLSDNGYFLWLKTGGNRHIGILARKEPPEWWEYEISSDLPQGLACLLVWLEWYDATHKDIDDILSEGDDHWMLDISKRSTDIRSRIRPLAENGEVQS